jgi:hypothetical protein
MEAGSDDIRKSLFWRASAKRAVVFFMGTVRGMGFMKGIWKKEGIVDE